MTESDSMRTMVAKFYGKEHERVTVDYAGKSYDVNPNGSITINDSGSAVHEVISSDDDFRGELLKPIIQAQALAVRFSLLEKLSEQNIKVINQVISKYDISLQNVNETIVHAALDEIREAVKPQSSLFTLFSSKGSEPVSAVQQTMQRIYHVLRSVDQLNTYQDLNEAMSNISGQSAQSQRNVAS